MKVFKIQGNYGAAPMQGELPVDDETADAIEKAGRSPCAMCSEASIGARLLALHFPQALDLPAGAVVFVGLCKGCQGVDAADLESHLVACHFLPYAEGRG
jgi:hypothetical protein